MKTRQTTINKRIELLEKQSALVREELNDELAHTKKKVLDIGKLALGIGGGLILSSIILRGLFKDKTSDHQTHYKSRRVYHKFKDQLLGEVSNQALAFLLGVAKDKVNKYLEHDQSRGNDDSEDVG